MLHFIISKSNNWTKGWINMIIDSHEYLMLPTELQIEKMDKAGVDKAILFTTTPHPEKAKILDEFKNKM